MPYSVSPQRNLQNFQPPMSKPKIELFAFHAAELGHDEMAQFVDEDDEAQAEATFEDIPADGISEWQLGQTTQHLLACPTVDLKHLLQAGVGIEMVILQNAFAGGNDLVEPQPSVEERGHRGLVGAVEDRPGRAARPGDLQPELQRAEPFEIGRLERAAPSPRSNRALPPPPRTARATSTHTGSAVSCPAG